jgi:hypothetical protein
MVTFLIPLNLFKGFIWTGPQLLAQFHNGFSCLNIFDDFYYALFNVWLVVLSCGGYVWLDQDVSFDPNFCKKDNIMVYERDSKADYCPKTKQELTIDTLFNRDEYLKKNSIS